MKKCLCVLMLACILMTMFASCGSKADSGKGIPGTAEEAIEAIYQNHSEMELPLMTMTLDLSDVDMLEYHTALRDSDKISDAAISEPMMGQAYSLVLIKVKNAADAADIARQMYDNIDMRKWICVMADTKAAAYSGDTVMFFMINSEFSDQATTDSILDGFRTACGGTITQMG